MFDNLREDWHTYDGDIWRQGLWVMWVYRFGRWRYRIRPSWLRKPFSLMYKLLRTTSQVMTGIELPCETKVGRRLRIEHFGGIIVSGDTLPQKKPDPAPLLHAAKFFGTAPAASLMIGDSVSDVKAARAAGFEIACMTYGYNHGVDIRDSNPDAVLDTMTEIRSLLEQAA